MEVIPLDFFARLQAIRKYRRLQQRDMARLLQIGQSSYSQKERGIEGGLSPQQIEKILDETQIDARWLFGQIDVPIEEADLRLRGPEKTLTQQMIEEIQELRKRTRPLKELDPLAERVVTDTALRRLVELLIRRRGSFERIEGYLEGLEEGSRETAEVPSAKKENQG
jgi:transcriptional regulator with XRE-family HTH domain